MSKNNWTLDVINKYIAQDKIHGSVTFHSDGSSEVTHAVITLRVNKPKKERLNPQNGKGE